MEGKTFAWAGLGWIELLLFYNPAGRSWTHWADFAGSSIVWWFSLLSLLIIAVPLMILGVKALWFIWSNKAKAIGFLVIAAVALFFWISQVEMKGQAVLGNTTLMYVLISFLFCFGVAAAIAISETKTAQ